MGLPKRRVVFQPTIFRCENVSFREGKWWLGSTLPTRKNFIQVMGFQCLSSTFTPPSYWRRSPSSPIILTFFGGGNSNIFWNFHPNPWGNDSQFDENIFQMGWFNHQLAIDIVFLHKVWNKLPRSCVPFLISILGFQLLLQAQGLRDVEKASFHVW